MDELDLLRFQLEYLPSLVAPGILAANQRSVSQQLAAAKLIHAEADPQPTILGC
jgi:ATP-dependent DNA helicase RecG